MKMRQNQKTRRAAKRQEGSCFRNGLERYVVLHPTKGFRDRSVDSVSAGAGMIRVEKLRKMKDTGNVAAMELQNKIRSQEVTSNAPAIRHNRSG